MVRVTLPIESLKVQRSGMQNAEKCKIVLVSLYRRATFWLKLEFKYAKIRNCFSTVIQHVV